MSAALKIPLHQRGAPQWRPGQSGNPSGMRAYPRVIRELLRRKRDEWTEELLLELRELAMSAGRPQDRIRAIELLLSYMIGKPREMPELDAPGTHSTEEMLAAVEATAAELRAKIAEEGKR